MEWNVITSIIFIAGETILGYGVGRFMNIHNMKKNTI